MNERTRRAQEAIDKWAPRLRLGDWRIRAIDLPTKDPEQRGTMESFIKSRLAVIQLHANVPLATIEREVVHELLHVRLAPMNRALEILKVHTPKIIDEAFEMAWSDAEEAAIEALTDALTGQPRTEWDTEPHWQEAFPVAAT